MLISGGRSNVKTKCNNTGNIETLTDKRIQYAGRVLSNIFAYKEQPTEIVLTSSTIPFDGKSFNTAITCVVGPVMHPTTKKKDSTTTFEDYAR